VKSAWNWIKRTGIGAGVLMVVAAVVLAANWKRLLIAWHWEGCKVAQTRQKHLEPMEAPSEELGFSHRIFGFPGDEYFTSDPGVRMRYHWTELERLGVVERRAIPVGDWARFDLISSYEDYPVGEGAKSIWEVDCMVSIPVNRFESNRLRPPTSRLINNPPCKLDVWDLKERMPLWEAFAARHNAEESERAAAEMREVPAVEK
jgi:hypothetical protein